MITNICVTNYRSESLTIDLKNPASSGFFVRHIGGLGPVKSNINMTQVLYIDGASFNSAYTPHRNIVLSLGFWEYSDESIDDLRRKTYRYFPVKKKLQIEITTDSRTYITTGYVESNESIVFSKSVGTTISILCEEAYLSALSSEFYTFAGIYGLFEFPFSNESLVDPVIELGSVVLETKKTILYDGDVETGVVITIVVGLDDTRTVFLYNADTGQQMSFANVWLTTIFSGGWFNAGDIITIDTRSGRKTITATRDGTIYNLIPAYNEVSDPDAWITVRPGANVIWFSSEVGEEQIQFTVNVLPLYEGV
jgi:hypothetical protein